ncbi:hypothetical protein Q31b_25360 [Novipirellula aureliae]|uniref:Uncharacterized protein n=1 Tax=Novipirellula aureliae TaxID=2527966 RepID=A0A5C6E494_9BACT|nr:hypothetical protein [Novipirellula aureliae]TWU43495.1 hypothetical protein Q31b_25360 [Novipirellula aureliae]
MNDRRCLACGGPLRRGFTLDRSGAHHRDSTFWASGEYWSYMLGHEQVLPIESWKCDRCGLLHNFAVDPLNTGDHCVQSQQEAEGSRNGNLQKESTPEPLVGAEK